MIEAIDSALEVYQLVVAPLVLHVTHNTIPVIRLTVKAGPGFLPLFYRGMAVQAIAGHIAPAGRMALVAILDTLEIGVRPV